MISYFLDSAGVVYTGDKKPGDRELTADELAALLGDPFKTALADAVRAIKEKSWRVETSGIAIEGLPIPTDRESQAMITGAVVGSLLSPAGVTRWQTGAVNAEGAPVFIELSAAQIQGIGLAVRSHVQACFDAREAKCAAVAGLGSVEAVNLWLAEHLEAGWPGGA